jgi:hypothetical protein
MLCNKNISSSDNYLVSDEYGNNNQEQTYVKNERRLNGLFKYRFPELSCEEFNTLNI